MKFTCDRCDAQYMISDAKVGPNGVKVRCKKCSHVILVKRATENGAAAAEAPAPAPAPAPSAGGTGEGLDAELGHAFDAAFGGAAAMSAAAASPGPDPDATQAVSSEEAASLAAQSAPPEPAATEWYVAIGQAQVGPLPLVEVRRKWEAGDIGPDSLVWRPGMGDWAPLTGVSDLSAYLAPVSRAPARVPAQAALAPAASRDRAPAQAAPAAEPVQDISWKPVGASALAALASEEIAGRQTQPKADAKPMVSTRSIVDGLPDGGGVDPTGAIPLQIRALEPSNELPVQKTSVARGAEQIRKKRSSTRALTVAAVLVALIGGGGYAAYDLALRPLLTARDAPAPAPAAPEKPAPAVAVAAPAPAQPAPAQPVPAAAQPAPAAPAPSAAPQPAQTPAPAAPATAAAAPEPPSEAPEPKTAAKEPAAKEPERAKPTRTTREPTRVARVEKKSQPAAAVAARAEAPQPPPTRKKGGDLLDFDSNDAALDEALGGKGSGGRSVYVPPPAGGTDAVGDRVTDSQVNETIMTRVAALQQCLADGKSSGTGVLKMRWGIAPDGSVQNLKCISPENANTPFAACVTNVIRGLRFPKTAQGRSEVTFPFKF